MLAAARRAQPLIAAAQRDRGSTPAGAGSARCRRTTPRACWAYPRRRGEHVIGAIFLVGLTGLPPLARGARLHDGNRPVRREPAHAGASSTRTHSLPASRSSTNHRCLREHHSTGSPEPLDRGLPPLVRGARAVERGSGHRGRPTPAGAGSTASGHTRTTRPRAYPRWCGEHPLDAVLTLLFFGLPPLVRGARGRGRDPQGRRGPTPAGAGSTLVQVPHRISSQAYPRWCGEHRLAHSQRRGMPGLPPLVRGARRR